MLVDDDVWFRLDDDTGHIVGIDLDGGIDPTAFLSAAELQAAKTYKARRHKTFAGGRCALRQALIDLGEVPPPSLLWNDRGAVDIAPPLLCSLSHKDEVAVAVVNRRARGFVGIDIEHTKRERPTDVRKQVLTEDEISALGQLALVDDTAEVLLRFSLKEALYKVLDPKLRRYVGFREVEVHPTDGGGAEVRYLLREGQAPTETRLRWRVVERDRRHGEGAFFVSTALAEFASWTAPPSDR